MSSFAKADEQNSRNRYHVPGSIMQLHSHGKDRSSGLNYKNSHHLSIKQCADTSIQKIQPTSTLASDVLSNSGQVNFDMSPRNMVVNHTILGVPVTNTDSGSYEVQTLQLTENTGGGSAYTGQVYFIFEGEMSAPIDQDDGATEVQTVLNALTSMTNAGGCTVALTSGTVAAGTALFTVTFSTYGNKSQINGVSTLTEDTAQDGCTVVAATTTTGTAPLKLAAHQLIENVVFINPHDNSRESIPRSAIFFDSLFMNSEEYSRWRRSMNLTASDASSSYQPDGSIAPGSASDTYYIRIPNPYCDSKLYLGALKEDIRIEVHFSNNCVHSGDAVVGDITLANVVLWLYGENVDGPQGQEMSRRLSSGKQHFRCVDYREYNINQTFASNTEYTLNVGSGLSKGPCGLLLFLLRYSNGNGSNEFTYEPISQLEFRDRDGSQAIVPITGEECRYLFGSSRFPNQDFFAQKNVYPLCFAADPAAMKEGQQTGYFAISGQEQLVLQTGTLSQGSGSYTLTVLQYNYQVLELEDGRPHFLK